MKAMSSTRTRAIIIAAVVLLLVVGLILSLVLLLPKKDTAIFLYSDDFTSNLPIVLLNGDSNIPGKDDTIVDMTIIYEGNKEYFIGKAETSIHGASSRMYEQKSINIKSLDLDGSKFDFPFFGFPKGDNWLLLNHFNDRAVMRNTLSFELYQQLGGYAPRYQYCEVFLNNRYAGIYLFLEKITKDKGRVDISKLKEDDLSGYELTGGYIWKYDVNEGFVTQYPSKKKIQKEQSDYLFKEFIPSAFRKLENATDAERETIINEKSFIDYFLMTELSANVDGYSKSRYFYKDRDDKDPRIHAGPIWDFDWAWKFIDGQAIPNTAFEWMFVHFDQCCTEHRNSYMTLFQSEQFRNKTIERWFELRENVYSEENIFSIVGNVSQHLTSGGAIDRYTKAYPKIFGGNPLDPFTYEIPPFATDYESELKNLRKFIATRLNFMDKNIFAFTTNV